MPDRRSIPSIEHLRRRPAVRALEETFGAAHTIDALRGAASAVRNEIVADSSAVDADSAVACRIESLAASRLNDQFHPSLRPVINATGVILHTNLGRAPLPAPALERIRDVSQGYANLELDLESGARSRRDAHIEAMLRRLTGGEAAIVVNNNAAAVLLVLAATAAGREVIVSRGELVEIGGGFRIPDVMAQSGATLREVGTTNRTRVADYAAAISDRTALLLRVHPSNFRIEGFASRPDAVDLVALARRFNLPVAEDLGSGHLTDDRDHPLAGVEPSVGGAIESGIDVCCFSGDKLLGGPQAGIIVGRAALLDRMRRHPLMRALRADKMTYAALEATLAEYAAGRAAQTVPVQRMLRIPAAEIRRRAEALSARINSLGAWKATLSKSASAVGGGSAPAVELPTWTISLERQGLTTAELESRLRGLTPPVIGYIAEDRVLLDLRTVLPADDDVIVHLIETVRP